MTITGNEVHGNYQNEPSGFHTYIPPNYPDVYKLLQEKRSTSPIKDAEFRKLGFASC